MRFITTKFLPFAFLLTLLPSSASGTLLQIIHTNDLHSMLEHSSDHSLGGYAAVKATIDRLRADAAAKGIDTLVLDGGDFTEGSEFYLADRSRSVWKAMDAMGYDAVTLGNHDWLMGTDDLDRTVGEADIHFPVLAANFFFDSRFTHLVRHVKGSVELRKSGAKIAVYGLTTDDFLYSWLADDAFLVRPLWQATADLRRLRSRNDFVIVLSHLGLKADMRLAKSTAGIDLIVGAHSHHDLYEPRFARDLRGRQIPIVQTGDEGRFVGDLLVDLEPGKPVQIVRYQLVQVLTHGPVDEKMQALVRETRKQVEDEYGAEWLREVVGTSEVPLEPQQGPPTIWSQLVADTLRESAGADVSLDVPPFSGMPQPAGNVTREQLIVLYPRMFLLDQRYGWNIWTSRVPGWVLDLALREAHQFNYPFTTSGVNYEMVEKNGKARIKSIAIGGKRIKPLKLYTVAFPEGIGRASVEVPFAELLKIVIRDSTDTGRPIWTAVEEKIRSSGGVVRAPASH